MRLAICMTSVNPMSSAALMWWTLCRERAPDVKFFVAFDEQSSQEGWPDKDAEGIEILAVEDQEERWPALHRALPLRHGCRRNFAYLAAMEWGADRIFETDDDNAPLREAMGELLRVARRRVRHACRGWFHHLEYFTGTLAHLRGWPLRNTKPAELCDEWEVEPDVIAYTVEGDPDVSAMTRLLASGVRVRALAPPRLPVQLGRGARCPVNAQATMWLPPAYERMYYPGACVSRVGDIVRGWIVQDTHEVVVERPIVTQDRNEHDLADDFRRELPLYLCPPCHDWAEAKLGRLVDETVGRELDAWRRAVEDVR